jgi:hypothetical protein
VEPIRVKTLLFGAGDAGHRPLLEGIAVVKLPPPPTTLGETKI